MQLGFDEYAPAVLPHGVGCLFQQHAEETAESDCDQVIFCIAKSQKHSLAKIMKFLKFNLLKKMESLFEHRSACCGGI